MLDVLKGKPGCSGKYSMKYNIHFQKKKVRKRSPILLWPVGKKGVNKQVNHGECRVVKGSVAV